MNDEEFQKLLNAEPPVVIKPGIGLKILAILTISLVVVFAGWMGSGASQNKLLMMLCDSIFFGGLTAVFFYRSIYTSLILNRDNFTVKKLFSGSATYAWKDVSNIVSQTSLITIVRGAGGMAGDVFAARSSTITFIYEPSKHIYEFDIPGGSLSLAHLTSLMNHWRERAIAGK